VPLNGREHDAGSTNEPPPPPPERDARCEDGSARDEEDDVGFVGAVFMASANANGANGATRRAKMWLVRGLSLGIATPSTIAACVR